MAFTCSWIVPPQYDIQTKVVVVVVIAQVFQVLPDHDRKSPQILDVLDVMNLFSLIIIEWNSKTKGGVGSFFSWREMKLLRNGFNLLKKQAYRILTLHIAYLFINIIY